MVKPALVTCVQCLEKFHQQRNILSFPNFGKVLYALYLYINRSCISSLIRYLEISFVFSLEHGFEVMQSSASMHACFASNSNVFVLVIENVTSE